MKEVMDCSDPKIAWAKMKAARRSAKQGDYPKARRLLEEITELDFPLTLDALVEKAETLRKQVEKAYGLRIARRILIATTLVVTVTVVLLIGLRKHTTLVSMEASVRRALVGLRRAVDIEPLALDDIDLSGIENIDLGVATVELASEFDEQTGQPVAWQQLPTKGSSVMLQGQDPLWSVNIHGDYLRLANLTLPERSLLSLERFERDPELVKLTVTGGQAEGDLDVPGKMQLSCNACRLSDGHSTWDVDGQLLRVRIRSEQIAFKGQQNASLGLSLTLAEEVGSSAQIVFGRHIPVHSLDFTKAVGDRVESSVVKLSLVSLVELRGKQITLEPGETLEIGNLSGFQITQLVLDEDMTLMGDGKAGVLKSGTPPFLVNRLPCYLEWMIANHAVELFIGTLVPVLSIVLALLYRLKILDET
jgi:hypothetical protein